MATRPPFWKWHRWKSIGSCLWPPSICIWNFKVKFQSKLDLCSRNHVVYRQMDGRTDEQGESSIPPGKISSNIFYAYSYTKQYKIKLITQIVKVNYSHLFRNYSYIFNNIILMEISKHNSNENRAVDFIHCCLYSCWWGISQKTMIVYLLFVCMLNQDATKNEIRNSRVVWIQHG